MAVERGQGWMRLKRVAPMPPLTSPRTAGDHTAGVEAVGEWAVKLRTISCCSTRPTRSLSRTCGLLAIGGPEVPVG